MKLILGLIFSVIFSVNSVMAGVFADDLSKCLVNSTNEKDREILIKWVYVAMSHHPIVNRNLISSNEIKRINKDVAFLFSGLILKACKKETELAVKYEGEIAIEQAFGAFGKVAMKGILSHPEVDGFMQGFIEYIDLSDMAKVFKPENSKYANAKLQLEEAILRSPTFPARPVWWSNDRVLAVGVVEENINSLNEAAEEACAILMQHGFYQMTVEVYDVVKIQESSDWVLLKSLEC